MKILFWGLFFFFVGRALALFRTKETEGFPDDALDAETVEGGEPPGFAAEVFFEEDYTREFVEILFELEFNLSNAINFAGG